MVLYKPHMTKAHTDETKKEYAEKLTKFCEFFEKKLTKTGNNFINSSKLTIGDFHVAAVLFNFVYNDSLGGGADYTNCGKEIIAKHAKFAAYVERLTVELKPYLEKRNAYPF